ncbi:WD40-repeat-containing domain protein [Dimargaris cristalligena]|uniref:WD40-repeat-containing domain protein n=1 Tax=Dimargaris cristalligena TaxID=215637 RepID=A0A4P9ZX46_9FUNG|nr:WD40-repeat-containing domain protein [Dimargaris cristalligena]|eukprot:RKP37452.1 WD40-repeat-containing domain protein [Dimargaris cristalligena]
MLPPPLAADAIVPPRADSPLQSASELEPAGKPCNGNGVVVATNGGRPLVPFTPPPDYHSKFDREEITRLMVQQMLLMGYPQAARTLEQESQCRLEHPVVSEFRCLVLQGQWAEVEKRLPQLELAKEKHIQNALLLIREQKFLESIEARATKRAIQILQNELSSLPNSSSKIRELSAYIFLMSKEALYKQSKWDGAKGISRTRLLEKLQGLIPPRMMVPPKRLESLFEQSFQFQKQNCPFHTDDSSSVTLFSDHHCDLVKFPRKVVHTFTTHTDEVWLLAFSPDGAFLASGSKDNTLCIWDVENQVLLHQLSGHQKPITCLAWSPDGTHLLSGSHDATVRLWLISNGSCQQSITRHTQPTTSVIWLPDGQQFISGGQDGKIYIWDMDANLRGEIDGPRVHDMALNPDKALLYVGCDQKKIYCYNIESRLEQSSFNVSNFVSSLTSLPSNRNYLLISFVNGGMQLWDVKNRAVVQTFRGHIHGNYILRPCFAGVDRLHVACGGEDGKVYIWNRFSGKILDSVRAHDQTVNAVAWSPVNSQMFATASDDKTVKM